MKKIFLIIIAIIVVLYISLWVASSKEFDVKFGISFDPDYATSLGLDWKKAYTETLEELLPKYLRVSLKWNEIEKEENKYNFGTVDFLLNEAAKRNTKVLLVIGRKAPRWPECHVPSWVEPLSNEQKKEKLFEYIEKSIFRYKNHPALELWQVENEPLIHFRFGDCKEYEINLINEEIALVKKLDPKHMTLITDSGEISTWSVAANKADLFGTTLYRTIRIKGGWVWRYDWLPPSFYKLRARFYNLDYEKFFISELQAEPWFEDGNQTSVPLAIQEETFNPEQFRKNISYAKHTGASRAYLWGTEWWYWIKENHKDDRYWNIAKHLFN